MARHRVPRSEDRCDVRLRSGRCREAAAVNYRANGQNRRLCVQHWKVLLALADESYLRQPREHAMWGRVVAGVLHDLCERCEAAESYSGPRVLAEAAPFAGPAPVGR
jgi:hypothetical protein